MDTDSDKRTPLIATGVKTIHPKKQNVAFGRWAMPVMVYEPCKYSGVNLRGGQRMAQKMVDPDPSDRKRALQSLCDYVFDSRRVASKEFESVVPHLKNVIEDSDSEVRLKAAECFGAIAATAAGRRVFENHNFHKEVLKLADDDDESIREAALTAIERICLSPVGAESMVRAGAIKKLIALIPDETDTNLVHVLRSLHFCCLVDPDAAVVENGLEALVPLLTRSCPKVQATAGTVIKDLTVESKGRNIAIQQSCIEHLLELCLNENDRVKAKALASLMMVTNATKGKYKALENEAIEKIFPLVKSKNVEVKLNATKVLTALGEAPEGRKELLKNYRTILRMLNDDYDEVQNAANKLIAVITFTP